ncbi:PREDICTED: methyl-CpG-binding domain-containing protein 7 [Theobroma cacao]|uniref:Methyl-CpG-binding domain-containing protein 7 n=1 Tax=Theobroma cacao TaxID=3641 RepID=A0AB32WUN2_THECC|nr:PREDICTED: methyl-CpG-binding domain-containing protein 7 [Theobroma cacao]
MKSKSSPSKKNPPPAGEEREAHDPSKTQLQIVDTRPTSSMIRSSVELPRGWVVEQRPRVNSAARPGRVDWYYYEAGSGRQFRSLTAAQEYLCGDMEYTRRPPRVKPGNENSKQIVPHVFRSASPFMLRHDWIVEEKPRTNVRYAGVIDRYYIEPGTGQRFRSMISVERYLSEMEASGAASEPSRPPGSRKKLKSAVEVDPMLDFTSPTAKVKWVLGGSGGSPWNPFMGESVVPEFVQQTWSDTFILFMKDKFCRV